MSDFYLFGNFNYATGVWEEEVMYAYWFSIMSRVAKQTGCVYFANEVLNSNLLANFVTIDRPIIGEPC